MPKGHGRLKAYLLSLLACAIAVPIAWELDAPSSCFLLAAMVSSFYGGRGPGYFTVLISAILFDLLFILPRFHFLHSQESYLRLGVFIAAMVLATELIEARHRAEESLNRTQAKLAQATADRHHIGVLGLRHSRDQPTPECHGCKWSNSACAGFRSILRNLASAKAELRERIVRGIWKRCRRHHQRASRTLSKIVASKDANRFAANRG